MLPLFYAARVCVTGHVGGISNMLNIARLAEAYEVSFAPHCPLGPIALASCMQVAATAVNNGNWGQHLYFSSFAGARTLHVGPRHA